MPLYAAELALVDRVADGTNAGFRRDDALLAIVILTDEDDCSREDNNFTIQNDVCSTMQGVKPVAEYKHRLIFDLYPIREADPIAALIEKGEWSPGDGTPGTAVPAVPVPSSQPVVPDPVARLEAEIAAMTGTPPARPLQPTPTPTPPPSAPAWLLPRPRSPCCRLRRRCRSSGGRRMLRRCAPCSKGGTRGS